MFEAIRRFFYRGRRGPARKFGRPPEFEFAGGPVNRSFGAYRAWIMGIMRKIKPGCKDDGDDAYWEAAWRDYWAKRDGTPKL